MQYFCDRCSDQNYNRQSYSLQALHFKEIGLNFLVTGHSQNQTADSTDLYSALLLTQQ